MGLAEGPVLAAPLAWWIGHVACLCMSAVCCVGLPSGAPRVWWRPSSDCAVFHVPSSEYLASSVHALTFLARFWDTSLEEMLPPEFSFDLDSLLTMQSSGLRAGRGC